MTRSLASTSGGRTLNSASSWSHIRNGERVALFMGAGWQKGVVQRKLGDSVLVQLPSRLVRCFDPRNVRPS